MFLWFVEMALFSIEDKHTRLQYRKRIREEKRMSDNTYELHDALLRKDGPTFWKCWGPKFEPVNKSVQVVLTLTPQQRNLPFSLIIMLFVQ